MPANEGNLSRLMAYIDIIQEHSFDVANAAGVPVQTLRGWIQGEGEPTMEQVDKILEFLHHKR